MHKKYVRPEGNFQHLGPSAQISVGEYKRINAKFYVVNKPSKVVNTIKMLYQQPLPTVIRKKSSFSVLTRLCTKLMPIAVIVEESRSGALQCTRSILQYRPYIL